MASPTTSEKPVAPSSDELDDLSRLQKLIEDFGVQFYSYLGVLQRDAPPVARAPDDPEDLAADAAARSRLAANIPQYARDIVTSSRQIDAVAADIERKMEALDGKERALLDAANFDSTQAGEEMTEAVDDAQKLLARIRDIIAARETEP